MAKWSVKKPFTVFVGVILIIVLGVVSFINMTPDLLPSLEMPYVVVVTAYMGASPEEVEEKVTKPIEQQMATLNNLKTLSSTSSENSSMIIMSFDDGANMDSVTIDIREKLDIISGSFDDYVGTPYILKLNPDIIPVTVSAVSVKGMTTAELTTYYEEVLATRIEGIEGVARVSVSGGVRETVSVEFNQQLINELNEQVSEKVKDQFGSMYGAVYGGINQAGSLLGAAQGGLSQMGDTSAIYNQIASARVSLQSARQQLVTLKNISPVLIGIFDTITLVQGQMQQRYEYIRDNVAAPGATEQEILDLCMQDPIYRAAYDALQLAEQELQAYGYSLSDLPALMQELSTLDEKIKAIDDALIQLDVQQAALQQGYTDATVGVATLTMTVSQLNSSLSQIESAEKAALDSTNLTNIITIDNVVAILSAQNFSMPAGYAYDGEERSLVTVGDKIADIDELKNLVLFDLGLEDMEPIRLRDVANISITDNAATTYAKLNGNDGLLLSFTKQSGYATATVSDNINELFESIMASNEDIAFTNLMDQGDYIHIVVNSVLENLLMGAALAVIILILFLRDIRPTIITAVSIPISVTFAVVLMYFSGITLNAISLSGLAVGVGMLVDNSIVVIENIYRLRRLGYSAPRAAISGASQVAGAITSSTLTTVCVFFPIVFLEGLTKQLFTDLVLTITYSLMASLVIALTLVPAMSQSMLKNIARRNEKKDTAADGEKKRFSLTEWYNKALRFSLDHKALALVLVLVLLVASAAGSLSRGFSFMPSMSSTQLMVSIETPDDMDFEQTTTLTDEISEKLLALDDVEEVGAMMSSGMAEIVGLSGDAMGSGGGNAITMYVIVNDRRGADKAVSDLLDEQAEHYGVEVSTSSMTAMTSFDSLSGTGVTVDVHADELDDLRAGARTVAAALEGVEGIGAIDDGIGETGREIRITIDKNEVMKYGLTVAQVYMDVASLLTESRTATALAYEQGNRDIVVIGDKGEGVSKSDIRSHIMTVKGYTGETQEVALSDIATITEGESMLSISRYNQTRYASVNAEVLPGYNVTLVASDVRAALAGIDMPGSSGYSITGESETIMSSMKDLALMLLLGVVIVYLIMVAQFQSLLSPFIVMFTIPLSFTGGFLALILCGMEVSIVAMIGFVMLVGVIVNNGIVLVDYMNILRREGKDRREAIVEACNTRMRPVMMTALTTILGLLPMALGIGAGAELMQPIAVVCIGGLLYATLMTLVIIPIMYDVLNKREPRKLTDVDLELIEE